MVVYIIIGLVVAAVCALCAVVSRVGRAEYFEDIRRAPANLARVLEQPQTIKKVFAFEADRLLMVDLVDGDMTCVARTEELAGALYALERAGIDVSAAHAELFPA